MDISQKPEEVSAVDALVRTILEKSYRDALIIATGLGASRELFEELLPMCVQSYCFNTTLPMLLDAKSSLPQTAIDKLIITLLENEYSGGGLYHALDAVALGPSDDVLLTVFNLCSSVGTAKGIVRVAKHMKVAHFLPQTIDEAINSCLSRGDYVGELGIIDVAKLGASQKCVDSLVSFFQEKQDTDGTVGAINLGASTSVVDAFVFGEKNLNISMRITPEMLSSVAVEHLIEQAIAEAGSKYAIKAAGYRLSGKLTPAEVEELISQCIATCRDEYDVASAVESAGQRKISGLTDGEITLLIGKCIQAKSTKGIVTAVKHRSSGSLTAEEFQDLATMYSGSVKNK